MTPDKLAPVHPGDVLREEFLIPLGLSQYALAKAISVPALRISQICAGKRAVTADTALRLARSSHGGRSRYSPVSSRRWRPCGRAGSCSA